MIIFSKNKEVTYFLLLSCLNLILIFIIIVLVNGSLNNAESIQLDQKEKANYIEDYNILTSNSHLSSSTIEQPPTPKARYIAAGTGPTPTPTAVTFSSIGQPISQSQWSPIAAYFPNMVSTEVRVVDSSTNIGNYNCAAWSINRATDDVIQNISLSQLQSVITNAGYTISSATDPDCSLIVLDDPRSSNGWDHVFNRWEGLGPPWNESGEYSDGTEIWESKLCPYLRIIHQPDALDDSYFAHEGFGYGEPILYYEK